MKRYSKLFTLTALLVALTVPAMAHGPWWGGRGQDNDCPRYERGQGWGGCQYDNSWQDNLTDDQKAQLKKVNDEFFNKTSSLRDEMIQKRLEMKKLMNSDKPDETKIWDTQKQISALKGQLDQERIRHQLSIKKIVPDAKFGAGRGLFRGWSDRPCARI